MKLTFPKVIPEVEERLGAFRQTQQTPSLNPNFTLTFPVEFGFRSLFRITNLQLEQRQSPQILMLEEAAGTTSGIQKSGKSLNAKITKRRPQYIAVGPNQGAAPKIEWKEESRGLQKQMLYPPRMANSKEISIAQRAAAKLLVTPSIPPSLVSRISLIPMSIIFMSIQLPLLSTILLRRQSLLQQSLSKLAMVASAGALKTTQRKVKVVQQLSYRFWISSTHEKSASSVIPGPLIQRPQQSLVIRLMSVKQFVMVQLQPRMADILSPWSRSSKFILLQQKKSQNLAKLLKYWEFEKSLFSRSQPKSKPLELALSAAQAQRTEIQLLLAARSKMHVAFVPLRSAAEQLYLQPLEIWQL